MRWPVYNVQDQQEQIKYADTQVSGQKSYGRFYRYPLQRRKRSDPGAVFLFGVHDGDHGKNEQGEKLITVSEIYYCEIVDRKCFAYLEKEVYQIDYGLQQFLDAFHGQGMVRISKSMCVNVFFISRIQADFNMRAKLILKNGETLQLNRSYKNEFYKYICRLRGKEDRYAAEDH